MHFPKALLLAAAATALTTGQSSANSITKNAKPVVDIFYSAVSACGRRPHFRPTISLADFNTATRYDHATRTVFLVPYSALDPSRRTAMDHFAAIGTLGLSGQQQYEEVFNNLLVAHELGHWVQEISGRPLNRWQAEFDANRMMVAFWRDHPSKVNTELRLANFIAQRPGSRPPLPADTSLSLEAYFNANIASIEADPIQYSRFQKLMVMMAMAETPRPTFCETTRHGWMRIG